MVQTSSEALSVSKFFDLQLRQYAGMHEAQWHLKHSRCQP
jgi:hypothetical protein